jgi:hypothetical protein
MRRPWPTGGLLQQKQTNNAPVWLKFVLLSGFNFEEIKDIRVLARGINATTDDTLNLYRAS